MSDFSKLQDAAEKNAAALSAVSAENARNRTLLLRLLDAVKGSDQATIDAITAQVEASTKVATDEAAADKQADDAAQAALDAQATPPVVTPPPVVEPPVAVEPPVVADPVPAADPTAADTAPASAEPNPPV